MVRRGRSRQTTGRTRVSLCTDSAVPFPPTAMSGMQPHRDFVSHSCSTSLREKLRVPTSLRMPDTTLGITHWGHLPGISPCGAERIHKLLSSSSQPPACSGPGCALLPSSSCRAEQKNNNKCSALAALAVIKIKSFGISPPEKTWLEITHFYLTP